MQNPAVKCLDGLMPRAHLHVNLSRERHARRFSRGKNRAIDPVTATKTPQQSRILFVYLGLLSIKKKVKWIILSIYGVKRSHSLRSELHSNCTPVEWKFTTQRGKSRPVHSIFTPKEVITDVTTQGVKIKPE